MNPYGPSGDPFMSNADQAANSFSNPMNMAHMSGGWGNNPAYQTPAYDAPYRPAYMGPNPYSAYQRPGFFGAVGNLMGGNSPYWGNPVDHSRASFDAISSKPIDGAANVLQNYIMPTAAFWVANTAFTRAMGNSIGKGIGSGLMRGLGMEAGAGVAGAIGGFAGGFALPLGLGYAASEAIDQAVFQPYIRSGQATQYARDSFSGITFGGAGGNIISGRGLSGVESSRIGSSIDRLAIRDNTFSSNEYHSIASMGMRSNLFDDVGSSSGITSRVSSIAAQIKTILAISKDPNIQTAIEELGKLKMGGASVAGGANSQAMSAYSSIGMHASAAGVSVQRMMSTVGSQGQYMFQMNGLTPYLGQMAASNAFSGFASAQRMGLMSDSVLARMGGVEGATQSAVAAQLTGMRTPYNMMGLAVRNMTGASTNGFVETASAYGAMASKNPLEVAGQQLLHGDEWLSNQSKTSAGMLSLERSAVHMLTTNGTKRGSGDKFSPAQIAMAMQAQGATPEQIEAYSRMRQAQTNSGVVDQNVKAFRAQGTEILRATLDQEGAADSWMTHISKFVTNVMKDSAIGIANKSSYKANETKGKWYDIFSKWYDDFNYGDSIKDSSRSGSSNSVNLGALSTKKGTAGYNALSKLNTAANSGGPGSVEARELLTKGFNHKDAKGLLVKFLKSQNDPKSRSMLEDLEKSPKAFNDVAAMASGNILNSGSNDVINAVDRSMIGSISTYKKGDVVDSLNVISQAAEIYNSDSPMGLTIDDTLKNSKYSLLSSTMVDNNGNSLSAEDKVAKISQIVKDAAAGGYYGAAQIAGSMNDSDPAVMKARRDSNGDPAKFKELMQAEITRRNNGSLRGLAVKTNNETSKESLKRIFSDLGATSKEITKTKEQAISDVDWGSLSTSMEGSATLNMKAAELNYLSARMNANGKSGVSFSSGNGKPAN